MKFDKGFYTFQFYYFDKARTKKYKTCAINDPVSMDVAYRLAKQHISGFGDSRLTYFFQNSHIKGFIQSYKEENNG